MSKKAIKPTSSFVRLLVPAGKAAPTPPVGPALGQRGVKSMDFCKQFNAQTAHINPGTPIPVVLTVNPDRTFTFITKSPQTSYLLKKAAGIEKGSSKPGPDGEIAGKVSLKHVFEIARIKQKDEGLKHLNLEQVSKMVVNQAKTMGLKVEY
ncbi:mitochondrial ribosomal protein L11 [Paraphysoderma sedebokerense]|nr:mitochondrial ribosomal protein L11 [Paraphysoderma sedebokerense]